MCTWPTSTSRVDGATVEVDDTGAGTLQLGGQLVEHIVGSQPALVVRVLLDYAATVGRDLTVLTRNADGRSVVHQLRPNGTVTLLRRPPTLPDLATCNAQWRRRLGVPRHWQKAGAAASRVRSLVGSAWTISRRWLVGYGQWLMLGAEILVLVGSLTFIVVALAPYL